jgi:thiol-disulfide isomerase/thioredoxin
VTSALDGRTALNTVRRVLILIRAQGAALALAAAFLAVSCGDSTTDAPPAERAQATAPSAAAPPPAANQPPPRAESAPRRRASNLDFTLRDVNGKLVRLDAARGKPLILDFWATWCGPCRREMPELNRIYQRYRDRGLEVIGVSVDTIKGDGARAVAPFVKEFQINYPIVMADQDIVDQFAIVGIPTTLFIAPDGKLVARFDGAGPPGNLVAEAEKFMRSAKASGGRKPPSGAKEPETAEI